MSDQKHIPYYAPDPANRWTVKRCPECGRRRYMRESDEKCGACAEGEPPKLQHSRKSEMDAMVEMARRRHGRAELEYLRDAFAQAAREINGKAETS